MTMEKYGVIAEGITPPEQPQAAKTAAAECKGQCCGKCKMPNDLASSPSTRLADGLQQKLRTTTE